ncbi:MAG: hypothetical protein IJC52_03530, partial [Clostridia bacterium]|nr:hypothetical protein [Clostridia bacterium]
RVNPLIIERGDVFYEGTFYNGVPLSTVYNSSNTATTSDDTVSTTITGNDALKAVWFYDYDNDDLDEDWKIGHFYKTGTESKTFYSDFLKKDIYYTAIWSYNRWFDDNWGKQRFLSYNKPEGATTATIDGTLLQMYATNNNVLLRTGMEPITYQTIYNTHGGQMTYPGSSDINDEENYGLIENENNYYITQTVVLSYYTWPTEMNKPNTVVTPFKYGYHFDGWYTAETGGTRIYRYNTKQLPEANTLHAQWTKDTDYENVTNTVTFLDINGEEWFTRVGEYDKDFEITIPTVTMITGKNGDKVSLTGWRIRKGNGTVDSSKVYTPGMKLTVTTDVTLVPYTAADKDVTVEITLVGAKLYLYKGADEEPTPITNGHMGIKVDGYTYSNIPRYTLLVAKPDSADAGKTWQINDTSGKAYMTRKQDYGTTICAEVSTNYKQYTFAANETITLSYAPALTNRLNENNAIIWTAPKAYVKDRQMMFYTQFELPEDAQLISCGTLYTKNTQVANLLHWGDTAADQSKAFHYAMVFRYGTTVETNSTGVRFTKASITNTTNQYYFMVTENKGNAVTYYARGYVHYQLGDYSYIAYSDVVSSASVPAAS